MGTNWTLSLKCAYCEKLNKEVWYAPSSEADRFKCEGCGNTNKIVEKFEAVKLQSPKE